MTVIPVIERELRAEARGAFTYWLRIIGAMALLAVLLVTLADQRMSAPQLGALLFGNLNLALFLAIWLLVPLLTADCLSRERREGTLGLLFLTPLTPFGVVSGKLFTHALRAAMMLLSTVPILALPLLLGGVNRQQLFTATLFDASSVCLALLAGLLASCCSKDGLRSMFAAEIISVALFVSTGRAILAVTEWQVGLTAYSNALRFSYKSQAACYWQEGSFGRRFLGSLTEFVGQGSLSLSVSQGWVLVAIYVFVASFALLLIVLLFAAVRVRRLWREEPPSVRRLRVERLFFAPFLGKALLRGRMRRTLNRNPIGWLEQHSAAARVTKWGWCLFIILAETNVMLGADMDNLMTVQYGLGTILAVSLAFSSAGSFRLERENGALELILVTPLRVGQVILGRLRGLWSQFLPGVVVVAGVFMFLNVSRVTDYLPWMRDSWTDSAFMFSMVMAVAFLTLPVIGLYFSLYCRKFLAAWVLALLVGVLAPELVARVFTPLIELWRYRGLGFQTDPYQNASGMSGVLIRCAIQILLAVGALFLLQRNLRRRAFALAA